MTLTIAVSNCQSGNDAAFSDPILAEGQRLAQQHCSNCHLTTSPDALDKETWVKHVLPAMAPNLGLEVYPGEQYYAGTTAAISYDNWQKLIAYYQTLAPKKLKPAHKPVPTVKA